MKKSKRNQTGYLGIRKRMNRWVARIGQTHLGSFRTLADALFARQEAVAARKAAQRAARRLPRPERRLHNESGLPDVTWDRSNKRWRACGIGDRRGHYLTVVGAVQAIEAHKRQLRRVPVTGEESVRRTNKYGSQDLTLAIARARLKNSGRFATEDEAEQALLAGPVVTAFGTYEMLIPMGRG